MDQTSSTRRPYDFDRVVRMLLTALAVVGGVLLLRFLSGVLIPFAIALLLAYLLNPIANAFQARLGGRRVPAVLMTVFGTLMVCFVVAIVVLPLIINEAGAFAGQLQQLEIVQDLKDGPPLIGRDEEGHNKIADGYRDFRSRQPEWLQQLLDRTVAALAKATTEENLSRLAHSAGSKLLPGLWGMLSGVVSLLLGLTGLVVVLLYLAFILLDYDRVSTNWSALLPPGHREPMKKFVEEFSLAMRRYFRGQFLVACTVAVLFSIGFSLIGLRMSILLGIFVGMLNMIPYLQTVGLIPALTLGLFRALETGSSVMWCLFLVLLVFAVVQTIQDALVTPRIMGRVTGLRPWTILLGVFIWGRVLGFLGLVLAIPLTCMALAYYSRFVLGKRDAKVVEE